MLIIKMDKSFLNEIVSKRNNMLVKKNIRNVDVNNTMKVEKTKDYNKDYLTIGEEDFDILNNIFKKNNTIDGNVKLILVNDEKHLDKLDKIEKLNKTILNNTNKSIRRIVYLGIFLFFSQVIITAVNTYLVLTIFN